MGLSGFFPVKNQGSLPRGIAKPANRIDGKNEGDVSAVVTLWRIIRVGKMDIYYWYFGVVLGNGYVKYSGRAIRSVARNRIVVYSDNICDVESVVPLILRIARALNHVDEALGLLQPEIGASDVI
jgi:hypothetical protein